MKIARLYCDWAKMAFKDKRRGYLWFCKECRKRGMGKNPPACPSQEFTI